MKEARFNGYLIRYGERSRVVTVHDRVIRDRGKARALVKPVRASRCSRAIQKKLLENGKSASRRDAPVVQRLARRFFSKNADPH